MTLKSLICSTFVSLIAISVNAQNNQTLSGMKSAGERINLESIQIESKILGENREIYVSLPPNYDQNVHDYPIILVLDAEFMFDMTRSMTTLWASRNYMPESIIIGLPNPTLSKRFELSLKVKLKNGRDAYYGGGDSENYIRFFKEELFPHLQKKYRVNSNRTIIGLSPTAGTVYHAFINEPKLFNHFITMNSGIQKTFDSGKTIAQRLIESAKNYQKATLYMGRGYFPGQEREDLQKLFIKEFNKENSSNVRLKAEDLKGESGYGIVVNCLSNAFRFIYPPEVYDVDYTAFLKAKDPTKAIESFYTNLSERYGYKIHPIESADYTFYNLFHMMRRLISSDRIEDAKKLVQLGLNYYPNSSNFYYRLAQINQAENDKTSAVLHLKKAIRLAKKYKYKNLSLFQEELFKLTSEK
ncbi:MAG: hypothetical protein HRT66_10890 [Flavobacteriaceae bacterium]|nr:hypothetical protein [Flavobacteriaceae bacterium]